MSCFYLSTAPHELANERFVVRPEPASEAAAPKAVSEPVPESLWSPDPDALIIGAPRDVAQAHARMLLQHLIDTMQWVRDRVLVTEEIQIEYADACRAHGVIDRPWNPVAAAFAPLIRRRGGPLKTYQWRLNGRNVLKRVRIYQIPVAVALPSSGRHAFARRAPRPSKSDRPSFS